MRDEEMIKSALTWGLVFPIWSAKPKIPKTSSLDTGKFYECPPPSGCG